MKKHTIILGIMFIGCFLFSGCEKTESEVQKANTAIYSFSGENEYLSVSNGVIVLGEENNIFYVGDIEINPEYFRDITAYMYEFYFMVNGQRKVGMANGAEDLTGGTLEYIGGGKSMRTDWIPEISNDTLYFEIEMTDVNEEEYIYQLPLSLTELTDSHENCQSD